MHLQVDYSVLSSHLLSHSDAVCRVEEYSLHEETKALPFDFLQISVYIDAIFADIVWLNCRGGQVKSKMTWLT